MGETMDWALHRPEMAAGMGARYTIAMINDCKVCRDTRVRDGESLGADEPFYGEVTDWRSAAHLSARERAAAEFAERFAINHLAMDDAYWDGLRALFGEDELADLTICCGMWLGMGRVLAVLGIPAPEERILV